MATTVHQAFKNFAGHVMLTRNQRSMIKDRRDRIDRYLRDGGWTVDYPFFGGSHVRQSNIRTGGDPKSDDVYIVLGRKRRSDYGGILSDPPRQLLTDIKATSRS